MIAHTKDIIINIRKIQKIIACIKLLELIISPNTNENKAILIGLYLSNAKIPVR